MKWEIHMIIEYNRRKIILHEDQTQGEMVSYILETSIGIHLIWVPK